MDPREFPDYGNVTITAVAGENTRPIGERLFSAGQTAVKAALGSDCSITRSGARVVGSTLSLINEVKGPLKSLDSEQVCARITDDVRNVLAEHGYVVQGTALNL